MYSLYGESLTLDQLINILVYGCYGEKRKYLISELSHDATKSRIFSFPTTSLAVLVLSAKGWQRVKSCLTWRHTSFVHVCLLVFQPFLSRTCLVVIWSNNMLNLNVKDYWECDTSQVPSFCLCSYANIRVILLLQICKPLFLLCYWRSGQWTNNSGNNSSLCRTSWQVFWQCELVSLYFVILFFAHSTFTRT